MRILVTRRLTLRPLLDVDADMLGQLFCEADIAEAFAVDPGGPDAAARFLAEATAAAKSGEASVLTLHRQRLAGLVRIGHATGALDFALGRAWRGQGLMQEALGAVLADLCGPGGPGRIEATVPADRPEALRLLSGLGFVVAGTARRWSPSRGATTDAVRCRRAFAPAIRAA